MQTSLQKIDISKDLYLLRYMNGVKLIKPEIICKQNVHIVSLNKLFSLPVNIFFLNRENQIQSINETGLINNEFFSEKDAIGKTAFDMFPSEIASTVLQSDHYVYQNNKYKVVEDDLIFNSGNVARYLTIKMPWYNDNDQLIGLIGFSILLSTPTLEAIISSMLNIGLLLNIVDLQRFNYFSPTICLSKREKQILSLLVRGKTSKEIGKGLRISYRTVEHYLEALKVRFNALTKSELIDKTIDYFYLKIN